MRRRRGRVRIRASFLLPLPTMARGWESKSVEESQADRGKRDEERPRLTPEQRARAQRRRGLELSRVRAAAELAATSAPVRRSALESALAQLDRELAELDAEAEADAAGP